MRTITLLAVAVVMSGCAGASIEKEMSGARGYAAADLAEIRTLGTEYASRLVQASGTGYTAVRSDAARDELKLIVCKCYKELKDKCRERADGLSGDQKKLWIKSNAVDWAISSQDNVMNMGAKPMPVDADTCS